MNPGRELSSLSLCVCVCLLTGVVMETTSACVCKRRRHLTFDLDDQTDDRSLCRWPESFGFSGWCYYSPPSLPSGSVQQKKLKLLLNNLFPAMHSREMVSDGVKVLHCHCFRYPFFFFLIIFPPGFRLPTSPRVVFFLHQNKKKTPENKRKKGESKRPTATMPLLGEYMSQKLAT